MPAVLKERACQPCFNGDVHVELNFRVTTCSPRNPRIPIVHFVVQSAFRARMIIF